MSRELLKRAFMMVGHALPASLQHEIKAELAKPVEPEPVAWMYKDHLGTYFSNSGQPEHGWLPLYPHPPANQEPVFLSDDVKYELVEERYKTGGMDWGMGEMLVEDVERAVLKANGIIKC